MELREPPSVAHCVRELRNWKMCRTRGEVWVQPEGCCLDRERKFVDENAETIGRTAGTRTSSTIPLHSARNVRTIRRLETMSGPLPAAHIVIGDEQMTANDVIP